MRSCLAAVLGVLMFAAPVQADWPWSREEDGALRLSLSLEDNVRGECWRDPEATLSGMIDVLTAYGISVSDDARTSLVLYAIGHPSATGKHRPRLKCVGVMQIRVSALDVGDDNRLTVTSLYDQERLIVSNDRLDTALGTLSRELTDNFSRRFSGYFD